MRRHPADSSAFAGPSLPPTLADGRRMIADSLWLPEYPHQNARGAEQEREREGNGEEDVLVRGVRIEAFVVEHQEDRGNGYPGHQDGRYAHGVEGTDPSEHTLPVEKEQPEPVCGQHEGSAEEGQDPVEQVAGEQRSPYG